MVSGFAFVVGMVILGFMVGMGLEEIALYLEEIKMKELEILYPKKFEAYKKLQKQRSLWNRIKTSVIKFLWW